MSEISRMPARELVDQVLATGEEMKGYTIEALLAITDEELGIEAVVRNLTRPQL